MLVLSLTQLHLREYIFSYMLLFFSLFFHYGTCMPSRHHLIALVYNVKDFWHPLSCQLLRRSRVLFPKLAARFVPFVALGSVNCLLLDVTNDDSLDLGAGLPIFVH